MLDINLIRENPEKVIDSQNRRGEDPTHLEQVISLDRKWRDSLTRINELRHLRNETTKEISQLKKEKKDASELIKNMKEVSYEIKELEQKVKSYLGKRDKKLMEIPNLLNDSVPEGETEEDDIPVDFSGKAKVFKDFKEDFFRDSKGEMDYIETNSPAISHVDIIEDAELADIPRAAKVAGSRFYYLKDELVKLDIALQMFALDFLREKGFSLIQPPYMLNRRAMEGVTDLSAFKDTLYKVENQDLHLIATAEHPLGAMFNDEILEKEVLPVKFAGISPCFRKEAGAHGKDTKGIFRVHHFNKVEQFVFAEPGDSDKYFQELVRNARELYDSLEIPYRVVNICAGEMGAVASKKLDIEAWMPAQGEFKEVVSASHALDYQSRRLNIRYRDPEENIMVHTLNSTAIATTRTIVAIIENFQENGKIKIPEVLHKYTGFKYIEFEKKMN